MNYSKFHKGFANDLNRCHYINAQDVLAHPEKYLGPNYKELLNYWFYWDSLNYEKWEVYCKRLWELDGATCAYSKKISKKLASEVIPEKWAYFLSEPSCELVTAHLYLDRNIPFTFLPLIFDL